MNQRQKRSPAPMPGRAEQTRRQNGWTIVTRYQDEESGRAGLVDLSHAPRWDVQDENLSGLKPFGLDIPDRPGQCLLADRTLILRQNKVQAAVWDLAGDRELPREWGFTPISEVQALLGLWGSPAFSIMERVAFLDQADPARRRPFLIQGQVLHVPCQVVVLGPEDSPGVIIGFSRGYGPGMVEGLIHEGKSLGLTPTGETAFLDWLRRSGS